MCFYSAENLSSFVGLLVPAAVLGGIKNTGLQASASSRSIIQHTARFWSWSRVLIFESSLSTTSCALLVCGGFLLWVAGRRPGRDKNTGLQSPLTVKGLSAALSKYAARFLVWSRVLIAEKSLSMLPCALSVYVGSLCWLLAAVPGGIEVRGSRLLLR